MSDSPSEESVEQTASEPAEGQDAVDAGADAHQTDDNTAADSSTADDKGSTEKGSILDAVTSALESSEGGDGEEEEPAEQSPGSEDGGQEEGAEAKSEDEDLGELTDEELNRYKPRTRKRMKQLLDRVQEKDGELDRLRPAAEAYQRIEQFASENGLDEQTVNNMLTYPVLRRQSPEQALQLIEREYKTLLNETGKLLPKDLHEQVEKGYLTKEHALELSQRRANEKRQQARAEEDKRLSQERAQREHQSLVKDVQTAIADWETSWSKSDPDYRVKRDEVHEQVELELARRAKNGTIPQSKDDAVKMVEDAKKRVEDRHKKFRPAKQEARHVSGGTSSSEVKPKPKSMYDVIESVVG